jgi:iodotyrosine deiodinase
MNSDTFIPLNFVSPDKESLVRQSSSFYQQMNERRSVRHFSKQEVPREVIENIIKTAGSAPSGANKQPWFFVAVRNKEIKKSIREAAEKEEKEFYESRATEEWLKDLEPIGTNWEKPFLDVAPWIIVVFKRLYDQSEEGRTKNYYVQESVGLACGFLIAAIHNAGLATLTHTPSPMNFLADILGRPANEKPFLLLPVGYAAKDATVPNIKRKSIDEIALFLE